MVNGTLLEGLEADILRDNFWELLGNSIFYTVSRRCGLNPMNCLQESDFEKIADFNTWAVLAFLGDAASRHAENLLKGIGKTVHKLFHDEMQKNIAGSNAMGYNSFNTLNRRSEKQKGGAENGTGLSPQRGLSVPESDNKGRKDNDREVRNAAENVPERTQAGTVPEYAAGRDAGQPSGADRPDSAGAAGNNDGRTAGEISGAGQGSGPDGLGGAHEQSESNGRGEHLRGIGIQLSAEKTDRDLNEAEEENASALSLPVFPSPEEQVRRIEERMAALYAGNIAILPDVVDEILREGRGGVKSHLRIIYNFMTEQTPGEYADFVRREYGKGGMGIKTGGKEYAVWFDGLGMQIALGNTVAGNILDKAFLS